MFKLANIDERLCIGCGKCIPACPVDAILGSNKHMHVIVPQDCIGCGLCVDPCPVDCIEMVSVPTRLYDKTRAKNQAKAKKKRELEHQHAQEALYTQQRSLDVKRNYILEALSRAKKNES